MASTLRARRRLLLQPCILRLQRTQAANVRAIGGADEMRQHVHLAEHVADDLKLAVGKDAYAIVKASDVMMGID